MAERIRCGNCTGDIREACDKNFTLVAGTSLMEDIVAKDPRKDKPTTDVDETTAEDALIQTQRQLGCCLSETEVLAGLEVATQEFRRDEPDPVAELGSIMTDIVYPVLAAREAQQDAA